MQILVKASVGVSGPGEQTNKQIKKENSSDVNITTFGWMPFLAQPILGFGDKISNPEPSGGRWHLLPFYLPVSTYCM